MEPLYDFSLVDWSRAQFALTAIFHWCFVPLTLGLSFIIAFMETLYVRTGDEEWKRIAKFWMTLFGINFAIGAATGMILEFEFGTNWSKYSWFVGDIFGAPLAVEGLMAFFLETTFIAVMFFGWNKVSKKLHLLATWLTAFGASLSALWILVANAWMQYPTGMRFNPDTLRNEMVNFWEVLFSPVAINKFLHTVTSGYVLSAVFVIGVSAWYLLKKREVQFARNSMLVASVFGIIVSIFIILTGDQSARLMAKYQPMKFAAMENVHEGQKKAPLVVFGVLRENNSNDPKREDFMFKVEIPNILSSMAFLDPEAYVPGIKDFVKGNEEQGIQSAAEKIQKGQLALQAIEDYKAAKKNEDISGINESHSMLDANFNYLGYGYLKDPEEVIPPIKLTFYSFRIMVALGFWFVILFSLTLVFLFKNTLNDKKWYLRAAIISIPLAYLASQLGWIVTEVGRQPWVIQDLVPTVAAVSNVDTGSVKLTFAIFAVFFTLLLIAEIKIISRQILIGPKNGGNK
jgi:cytochrome d ubiquinol oxidase subunit I